MLHNTRWYHKWWGVVILVFACALLTAFLVFVFLTLKYWWQIKKGGQQALFEQFYGNFSQVDNSSQTTAVQSKSVKRKELETDDDPYLGNPQADIVIVEFLDFKCPNCQTAMPILKKLLTNYGYKIKLIVRDFPVDSTHPGSSQLSELAYCAHQQNRFWNMYDILFANQDSLSGTLTNEQIQNLANQSSVDYNKLLQCLNSSDGEIENNKDYADGLKFGLRGTPTFFVNGQKLEGVVPYDNWEKIIKSL